MTAVLVRPVDERDAPALARIYNHYVLNTCVTFETEAISAKDMLTRIREIEELRLPWLVAATDSDVLGFAYASKWKGRCAYRHSVESTIYLDPDHTGNGTGTELYSSLLNAIRDGAIHAVIGGISLPNDASVALHEKLGFRKVGHFEEVGRKFGRWVDVGYWQLVTGHSGSER